MSTQEALSATENPLERGPQPPFEEQKVIAPPGREGEMYPKADHGENSYRGSGKLTDKVALITGGDSGIGRAVALAFAREGADVVIAYLNEHEDARETERLVTEAGRRSVIIPGDIQNEAHCQMLVEDTVREFGRLDILVNNAAYQMSFPTFAETPTEEFDRMLKTNVYAAFFLVKAAVPHLKAGASIINVSSIQAYQPSPNILAYAITKGALVTLTKGLAQELIAQGIRVNSVAPGPVWTPLIPSTMPEEKTKEFGKDSPTKRPAQPAELAPVFVLLASEDGSYINGAVYAVTGGEVTA